MPACCVGHAGKVNCVCVAPDGETVISGGEDKTIRLWKISSGRCVQTIEPDRHGKLGHTEEVMAVAVAPDQGVLASASADGTIRTWKVIGL